MALGDKDKRMLLAGVIMMSQSNVERRHMAPDLVAMNEI